MRLRISLSASAIALSAALFITPAILDGRAEAAAITGSDSIITNGGLSPSGGVGDLLSATSFVFGSTSWAFGAGDFSNIPSGTALVPGDLTIDNLAGFSFTSAAGNFASVPSLTLGTTTYTSAIVGSSGSTAAGTESLTIYLVGHFTPAGPIGTFDPNNASETISFTETGITDNSFGSFSVSATFASPPVGAPLSGAPVLAQATDVPEPASFAMFGTGLLGLITSRCRRSLFSRFQQVISGRGPHRRLA